MAPVVHFNHLLWHFLLFTSFPFLFVFLPFFSISSYIFIWICSFLLAHNWVFLAETSKFVFFFSLLSSISDFSFIPVSHPFLFLMFDILVCFLKIIWFWGYLIEFGEFGVIVLYFFFFLLFEGRILGEGILIIWNALIFTVCVLLIVYLCRWGQACLCICVHPLDKVSVHGVEGSGSGSPSPWEARVGELRGAVCW